LRHEKERFSPRETNVNQNALRKVEGKSINSRLKKVPKGKRLRRTRQTDFRSFGWYQSAALSVAIGTRASTAG
jgi:hypothetical protein